MREIAPGLWQLAGLPPHLINVYLAGDVLIDAATRWARYRVLRQLRGRNLSLVALTHCHPDHQGVAALVCRRFGVPLACHEADAPAMEGREPMLPRTPLVRLVGRLWSGPPHPVARRLRGGETVAGFRVIHTPGHTPGHVIYFRERDRVAIAGDLLNNLGLVAGRVRLQEPPHAFSADPLQNRRSIQTLLELGPSLVCFGHGPPLGDVAVLERLVERPAEPAPPALLLAGAVG
jgi:glyoxylase-like metal-dependent hydrolase (beta-lactamase superfamily II)